MASKGLAIALRVQSESIFEEEGITPRQLQDQRDDLLHALKAMVEFFQPNSWGSNDNKVDALADARAAISKAEGRA